MANLSRTDLNFILQQILIAEADSAAQRGGNDNALPGLVGNPLLSLGLRNVDGTFNNLVPGRSLYGSADQVFPRVLTPSFQSAETVPDGFGTPGQPVGDATSYLQTNGLVFDTQPRAISNLIADQSDANPAAVAAAANTPGSQQVDGVRADGVPFTTNFIPNVTPDAGLSAPYNSWFTLFGQFFDHGLDLVNKGQSGTVFVPLKPDDPLYSNEPGAANFMTMTRATNLLGPDGVLGTNDDVHNHRNQTTPFIDQNQTYTSHPSHQVFIREYVLNQVGDPVSTGKLLEDGATLGGLATWADIKQQANDKLGIRLTDADLNDLPLLATDSYGQFIPGPNGFAQLVLNNNTLLEGTAAGVVIPGNVVRTGHAFLDDIAHTAAPRTANGVLKTPDADNVINAGPAAQGEYDNELLNAHFITGDGRGNENIGLTTVHTVFHAEHNRTVDFIKTMVTGSNDPAFVAQWHLPNGDWNGERLFQAGRFATEMQYQHLVFEEFARKVQPNVDAFVGYNSTINPAIMSEFAHVVYRFGHSMLTESVDRINTDGNHNDIGLVQAFLNPVAFRGNDYANNIEAASAVVKGMTQQIGNEIDEFTTDALRNNLVGLPLDLAAINLARGRDTGMPSLNAARRMFYDDTGNSVLQPYESWIDFQLSLRHPESLTNFIAAYGTHPSIASAVTFTDKRIAADALINGIDQDAIDFMNSTGAYASLPSGVTTTGLDDVDFWIGGLAEMQAPFGGLLGSTFNFVFETQMERLQDGDRFYYLARTAGMDFLTQLEENSFAEMIMTNLPGVKHLPFDVFSTPTYTFELGVQGNSGPIVNDPGTPYNETNLLTRVTTLGPNTIRYAGKEHIVMGGTENANRMHSGAGDDTLWGDGGNDRLEGGAGNDSLNGGTDDDIITDSFGDDTIKGGDGNDVINGGPGLNLILGGAGSDSIVTGNDVSEVFAGPGNDFIFGNTPNAAMIGNEGDDWIQNGTAGGAPGDNQDPFSRDPVRGNDVFIGSGNVDRFIGEGGDDLMNGMTGADRNDGSSGFDWVFFQGNGTVADIDLTRLILPNPPVDTLDRFLQVEGASGWNLDDTIRGDNNTSVQFAAIDPVTGQNNALDNVNNPAGGGHSAADRIAMIDGLSTLLGGASTFSAGNILLGGSGSDQIEGRGGNDIIDGDAWLNVRISVRNVNDNSEIATFDNMTSTLRSALQAGTYNPGQLRIVREIKSVANDAGVDKAIYRDASTRYTLTYNPDGSVTVNHVNPTAVTVNDGVDTLRNIEQLQFTDRIVTLNGGGTQNGTPGDDNLTGTPGDDILDGLAGNDTLDGLGGVDTLIGGAGNDTFIVDIATDIITELANGGTDSVQSAATFTLSAQLENLTLTGAAAINGTGNASANLLTGNSGNNTLSGLGGIDTLNGLDGVDTLNGGPGNDTYIVDTATDTLVELAGGGIDSVQSPVTFTLLPQIENLTLTGTAAINGTGNTAVNILTGNGGNNTLSGLGGNDTLDGLGGVDTLDGGTGNDIYVIDTTTDTIIELAGGGSDLVQSTVSFTLIPQLERLTLTGTAAINGTGNAAINTLIGNGGNNILTGFAGADTLTGGLGADSFNYTAVAQSNSGNRDIITDFVSGIDKINLNAIDADITTGGNQNFTTFFVGNAAFTGAGQVRYVNGMLEANINGDQAAELQIQLAGAPAFVGGDLVA